jgi:hypothetical protein
VGASPEATCSGATGALVPMSVPGAAMHVVPVRLERDADVADRLAGRRREVHVDEPIDRDAAGERRQRRRHVALLVAGAEGAQPEPRADAPFAAGRPDPEAQRPVARVQQREFARRVLLDAVAVEHLDAEAVDERRYRRVGVDADEHLVARPPRTGAADGHDFRRPEQKEEPWCVHGPTPGRTQRNPSTTH